MKITIIGKYSRNRNCILATEIRKGLLPSKPIIEPIYSTTNNLNRKTKSILEETEKNNNNQSIKESIQFKDNIKKNKIIKIENIQNNRVKN